MRLKLQWVVLGLFGGYMAVNVVLITLAGMWGTVVQIVGPISAALIAAEVLFWAGIGGAAYAFWSKHTRKPAAGLR